MAAKKYFKNWMWFSAILLGVTLVFTDFFRAEWLTQNSFEISGLSHKEKISMTKKGRIPLKDRIDLAILQEIEITKDLTTNTVPRERLLQAYAYAEQLRNQSQNNRVAGAIPGMNWIERGPKNVGGRTRAIMVDPNDATRKMVWSAGVGGGLWKTTDITAAAPAWIPVNDLFNNIAITTIAFNPVSPLTMYFGTGEGYFNGDAIRGDGIWKTTDGGATWNQLASTVNANFQYNQKIVVHPVTGDVYAGTRDGLFRSTNAGTTWVKVLGAGVGASDNRISDIEIGADNNIYAGIGIFTTDGVYKSATGNAGAWTKLNTGSNGFATTGFSRVELACAPSNASVLYALTQSTATNGIYQILQSTDGGTNWTVKSNPVDADGGIGADFTRGQGWYDLIGTVDPNNANILFVGGVDLFKTINGGNTWQQISHWYGGFGFQEVHADQHAITFEPGNSSVIYFGNDGGIYRTANGTATIPSIITKSENYNVTQFYACAMNPTAYSSQFIAGAQDNGSQQYSSLGINSTIEVTGGDGCFTHIDQDQPQYQFTSYVFNNYYRSTNGGASFAGFTGNNTGSFVNPTDYDNLNNNLYACNGNGNYYVILNAPVNNAFTTVTVAAFNSGRVTHVSVSPNTANRVFFGLSNGRIVKADNAHTTTPVAVNLAVAGMPGGWVSCIAIEDGNDNHLIATYSNYGSNSVWESLNGGTTWTSVEGNLPDMPVRWALFNPNNSAQAIIATELGVWSTDLLNGGATVWAPSNIGMANVRTNMLQVRTSDKLVIAATHGRGLFSSDVFTVAYPDFVSDRRLTYIGKPISFSDASYKSTSWSWNFGDATTSSVKNPVKMYTTPGLYTVTLQINGDPSLQKIRTSYVQVLPNRGIPYNPAAGGNFDVNALDFGAETFAGTPFQRGNSAIVGKNGTFSGSNAWVTGLTATNYLDNSDTRLWTPNYNFTAPGAYTLKFYRKNIFEIGWDGFRVEYSLDKGDTWTPLGIVAANWYDFANGGGATAYPVNQPYFNATRSSFTLSQFDVSFLSGNGNVAFRIRFKSDVTINASGMAIDDFEIIGPSNTPLPVELANFSGKAFDNFNELNWTTLSEINNDRFELERSVNGTEFIKVGTVEGKGTTSETSDYVFDDEKIENRNYYYRLKQIDFNGKYKYSGIILLKREVSKDDLVSLIFPNPFTDVVNISFNKQIKESVLVELFDLAGKKIYSQIHPSEGVHITVNFSNVALGSGTFLMKISVGGEVSYKKVNRLKP